MEEFGMLENIKAHSIVVEKVARLIAYSLRKKGIALSLQKTTAGALLHDIGKTLCLEGGEAHAAKGREICYAHGLPEIADIVGEHIRLRGFDPNGPILEKEIVYYADKRVNHDAVVSLEERLAYLIRRYGKGKEPICQLIRKNFDFCREVEKKLFRPLDFQSEAVGEKVMAFE
jgi:putative nucleotidyltransferase with HDIG domain